MTEFEKLIYNKHLAITRSSRGTPFKLRKNWNNIDDTTKLCLKKLSNFFNKHKSINMDKFFKAPHAIYTDKPHTPLDFYLSMKAVKLYREYINMLNRKSPDSEESLKVFKESAKFVIKFCAEKKIKFSQYPSHCEKNSLPSFYQHLKHGKVSVYFLFMFSDFEKHLKTLDPETRKFVIGDVVEEIPKMRAKFYNCNENTKNTHSKIIEMAKKILG